MRKIILIIVGTMILSSCIKYYEERPPIRWNNDYDDISYIWEHHHTLAKGDTVMVWGWLYDYSEGGITIIDDTNTDIRPLGYYERLEHILFIRTCRCYPWLDHNLIITVPEKPCKVYATAFAHPDEEEPFTDWGYEFVISSEDDVLFVHINENE